MGDADKFIEYARYDWVQSPSGVILHHLAELDAVDAGEWCATGRSACGVRTTWRIPGFLSRLGAERCRRCCDRLGIARGIGSPSNDPALRRWLGLAVLLFLAGCATVSGVVESAIPGERFTPPAHYAGLWAEVHADLGREPGDFAAVRWYQAPGPCLAVEAVEIDGEEREVCTRGTTYSDGRVGPPVIVLASESVGDDGTVRHEMLHVVVGMLAGHGHWLFESERYRSNFSSEGR